MAFSKLTGSQVSALTRISALKRKLTLARQDLRQAIEEQLEVELELQNSALTEAVREAAQMRNGDGRMTPKAALKRALGNSDHASLQGMLEGVKYSELQPVKWDSESKTVTIADFTFGNEFVKGGTYGFDAGEWGGIEYYLPGVALGDWVRSKFDLGEDVMAGITTLTSGWNNQAREQGAE